MTKSSYKVSTRNRFAELVTDDDGDSETATTTETTIKNENRLHSRVTNEGRGKGSSLLKKKDEQCPLKDPETTAEFKGPTTTTRSYQNHYSGYSSYGGRYTGTSGGGGNDNNDKKMLPIIGNSHHIRSELGEKKSKPEDNATRKKEVKYEEDGHNRHFDDEYSKRNIRKHRVVVVEGRTSELKEESGGETGNDNIPQSYYSTSMMARRRQQQARRGGRVGGEGGRNGISRFLDRHSGTGRGREMKRSGTGSHNWGNDIAETQTHLIEPVGKEEKDEEVEEDEKLTKSVKPNETSSVPPSQPLIIDYSEYQRAQRIKRANLLQDDLFSSSTVNVVHRSVDETELEKAGFQKYQRDTDGETGRHQPMIQAESHDHDEDDTEAEETSHRQRTTYNISEFTGRLTRPRGTNRGRSFRSNQNRYDEGLYSTPASKRIDPITLDLTDAAAFPSLA